MRGGISGLAGLAPLFIHPFIYRLLPPSEGEGWDGGVNCQKNLRPKTEKYSVLNFLLIENPANYPVSGIMFLSVTFTTAENTQKTPK